MSDKPIKLLFITYTHSNGGGAEKVLTNLVNNLSKDKYDITIQEIERFNVKKENLNDYIKFKRFPLKHYKKIMKWFSEINYYFLYTNPKVLKALFKWDGFDIVIAWNYQLPSFALMGFEVEYTISHFHGAVDDLDIKKYPLNKQKFLRQKEVWGKVKHITTISEYSKESAIRLYPDIKNKIEIVYNGTDIDEINKRSFEYSFEESIDRHCINLISVARLDDNKNISLILKALKILKEEKIDFKYFIIGNGEDKGKLERETRNYSLCDSVVFLGYVDNPIPIIKSCDILCMSSFSEGWPTVVTEAMALRKPFVSTPVAGAKDELCDNEKCGLIADYDPEDYANKLKFLINHPDLQKRMGEEGFKNIQNYTIDRSVAQFERILDNYSQGRRQELSKFTRIYYCFIYVLASSLNIPQIYKNISYINEHKNGYAIYKTKYELFATVYRCIVLIVVCVLIPIMIVPCAFFSLIYCIILGLDK